MDRQPKAPPFPVGAKLVDCGPHNIGQYVGLVGPKQRTVMIREPGLIVVVASVRAGRQGTLRHLRDEDGPMFDDRGDKVLDWTRDGYSVVVPDGLSADDAKEVHGRCVFADDAHEWELI